MSSTSLVHEVRKIRELIIKLEGIISNFENYHRDNNYRFNVLLEESNSVLREAKTELSNSIESVERTGVDPIPDIGISDAKLKSAWIALFRHPAGITSEELSRELNRHRSTVSTYLNTLVLMELAEKERIGPEIYYKAILKKEGKEA